MLRYIGAPVAAVAAVSMAAADAALAADPRRLRAAALRRRMEQRARRTPPLVYDARRRRAGHPSGFPAPASSAARRQCARPAIVQPRRRRARLCRRPRSWSRANTAPQVQTHCCMEPHAIVADWRADGLTVYMSTQFTAGVRQELARDVRSAAQPRARDRRRPWAAASARNRTLGNYGRIAVMLSRQAQSAGAAGPRPRRGADGYRQPARHLAAAAHRRAAATARSPRSRWQSYGTAGVGVGAGVGNIAAGALCLPEFRRPRSTTCSSMPGRGCAMRGPGNTPGAFALEQAIDELAEQARHRSARAARPHRSEPGAARGAAASAPSGSAGQRRHAPGADPGPVKRGIGMAQSLWGANVQTNAACEVRILRDGSVEVLSSVQDIGTGIGTVLAQIVAEEFGLRPEDDHRAHRRHRISRPGRPRTAAAPPPRSRRRRAPPRGSVQQTLFRQAALRSECRRRAIWSRATEASWCATIRAAASSFREAAAGLRTDQHQRGGVAQRRLWRLPPPHAATPRWRSRTSAACSSPRSRSIPRPASSASSASSPCRIAAGR